MLRSLRDITALLVMAFLVTFSAGCYAQAAQQKSEKHDPQRREAIELYDQGRFVDAMPLFEKLSADLPSDVVVREHWAWCLFQYAATLPDLEQRKKVRAHARIIAVQAKDLGDNSQLLQVMLEQPEDGGSEVKYSDRKEVDDAMKTAEADFARGDMDRAREGYLRVLLMDHNHYDAALFIGDVYFKQHVYGSAGEWFSRAIQIDPNRETAYRYWGDALVATGKEEDARSKFIEAIIADPYNRRSWTGMTNWLQRNKLELNDVKLKDGAAVTQKDEKNITITIDDSGLKKKNDPNGVAWMTYGIGRAGWRGEKFKKEFPNETEYRHTLKEESDSLSLMITVLKEQKHYEKKLKDLDPSLQALIKIQEAGFLDPYCAPEPRRPRDRKGLRAVSRGQPKHHPPLSRRVFGSKSTCGEEINDHLLQVTRYTMPPASSLKYIDPSAPNTIPTGRPIARPPFVSPGGSHPEMKSSAPPTG